MECARHERVVFHRVAKNNKFTCANALLVGCCFCGFLDDARHFQHGVHVQARARGAQIHRRAHEIGGCQCLWNRLHELDVGAAGTFLHQRGEAAHKVHAYFLASAIHGLRNGGQVVLLHRCADLGNGRHGDALVDNGNAEFAFKLLGHGNQVLRSAGHAVVHLAGHGIHAAVAAAAQGKSQRDGANVQVLLVDHVQGFGNLCWRDLHGGSLSSFSGTVVRLLVITVLS